MKGNKVVKVISCLVVVCAIVGSLGFSFISYNNTAQKLNEVNYTSYEIDSINSDVMVEKIAVEKNQASQVISTDTQSQGIEYSDNTNITFSDGKFIIRDCAVNLKGYNFYVAGTNTIEYDNSNDYFKLNDNTIINVVSADKISNDISSCFKDKEDNLNIIIEKKLDDDYGVFITCKTTSDNKDSDKNYLLNMLQLVNKNDNVINVFGKTIDSSWSNLILTSDFMSLNNNEDTIYLTQYEDTITGAGFDNDLGVQDLTIKYSDIKDADSSYIPYMIQIGDTNIKLLAKSNEQVINLFK